MISLLIVIPGWKLLRSLGGLGLVILGVVDSSVIPTFGSLDILTAILATKTHELWPYYAAASTVGSLVGAYLTYRISVRAGEQWLEKRIGGKRSRQIRGLITRWGFAAVFVSCIAPPFPTSPFFVGAGALRYPPRKIRISRYRRQGSSVCNDRLSCREVQPYNTAVSAASART